MLALSVTIILMVILVIIAYLWYMAAPLGNLKKLGIDGPNAYPVVGTLKRGSFIQQAVDNYAKFKDRKVHSAFMGRDPRIVVTDLELIRDIFSRHFNSFPDRRPQAKMGNALDHMLTNLQGAHWKHVRSTVSPTFTSGKLKRMSRLVEGTAQSLVQNINMSMEKNEPIEMKKTLSDFTMDVIASTGFGFEVNSLKDPENAFIMAGRNLMQGFGKMIAIYIFFPFLLPLMRILGISLLNKKSLEYFVKFVDTAVSERRSESDDDGRHRRHDFLQLLVDAEREHHRVDQSRGESSAGGGQTQEELLASRAEDGEKKQWSGLSSLDIQGSALIFIFAGFETVSSVMSWTLFLIALNPDITKKVQDELTEKLGSEAPTYDNVSNLTYMEMCLNEAMRMYPPALVLERHCIEDTEIRGFHFPKGYTVMVPVYAIHHDPNLWPEPEEFKPERFSPEEKDSRHQYSFLGFGHGPRNCVGMRLAMLEMKIGLAAILSKMTPVACEKTIYPPQLESFRAVAKDGLWLKFEQRT